MQRSFVTDRFKTSSWQKVLSSHVILPQLSLWHDFPATTWLKSLQQQHFISAHCETDFTWLRFVSTDQKWPLPKSPDESEGHFKATDKRTQNRKPHETLSHETLTHAVVLKYNKNINKGKKIVYKNPPSALNAARNVHSTSKSHHWEGEKAIYQSIIHTEGSMEYNRNIVDCNSCLSTASNAPFTISLVMKRDFQIQSCLRHLNIC